MARQETEKGRLEEEIDRYTQSWQRRKTKKEVLRRK
jgi:hypothetical protein